MYRKIEHWPEDKMTIEIAMGHLKASRPTTAPKLLQYYGGWVSLTKMAVIINRDRRIDSFSRDGRTGSVGLHRWFNCLTFSTSGGTMFWLHTIIFCSIFFLK